MSVRRQRRQPLFKFVLRLAQITVDGGAPKCFHCERELPPETKCELSGKTLTFHCPFCACMTPVRVG